MQASERIRITTTQGDKSMNEVILIGRLTRDPELKYSQKQVAFANFSIAIDRPKVGGKDSGVDYPKIVVFGKVAENCDKYLSKGSKVAIQGALQTGSYTNKDGRKIYTTNVVANKVEFLQTSGADFEEDQTPAPQAPDGFEVVEGEEVPF